MGETMKVNLQLDLKTVMMIGTIMTEHRNELDRTLQDMAAQVNAQIAPPQQPEQDSNESDPKPDQADDPLEDQYPDQLPLDE